MKKPSRILVPIDFSNASLEALDMGASMARQMQAELIVLTVAQWPDQDPAYYTSYADKRCVEESLQCLFSDRLQTMIRSAPWAEERMPRIVVRQGKANEEILRVAEEERVDLIVMGTHGRRGVGRMLLGSVTEDVIRRAAYPVLAVREGTCHPQVA